MTQLKLIAREPTEEMLTRKRLKELLHYDPDTGIFTYIKGYKKGMKAGWVESYTRSNRTEKRIRIKINGVTYRAARLAHLYMTGKFPSDEIDHFNHSCLATRKGNQMSVSEHKCPRCNRLFNDWFIKGRLLYCYICWIDYRIIYYEDGSKDSP